MGFRSTPDLPAHADVVIIGAGITGVNAARFLVEGGKEKDIVVLEAREVCWGATGRVSFIFPCYRLVCSNGFSYNLRSYLLAY
jgi:cation diffusion facilitator CzcD-associated flavoprotein CzcO